MLFSFRITTMQANGQIPNYEASVAKLFNSEMTQRIAALNIKLFGVHEFVAVRTDLAPNALPTDGTRVVEDQLDFRGRTTPLLSPGELGEVTVDLEPGAYVLFCNVPFHYDQGMFVSFTVTE